jgi:hypothetical protein
MTRKRLLMFAMSLLWVSLAGCGEEREPHSVPTSSDAAVTADDGQVASGDSPDGALEGTPRGACAVGDVTGLFEVVYGKNFSYFSGDLSEFPSPVVAPEELLATGACTVRRQVSLTCTSVCQGGMVCGKEGSCVEAPGSVGVGTVSVFGLLAEVALEPTEGTGFYMESSLPHPPFEPGSPIRLDATGGDDAAFTLYGVGVDKVEVNDDQWNVSPGETLSVSWVPDELSDAQVEVVLSIDQLGKTPAEIFCLTEDTGELEIAAELIDLLLEAGISGSPAGTVTRRTVDSDMIDRGCVELRVYGSVLVPVTLL